MFMNERITAVQISLEYFLFKKDLFKIINLFP